jgi:hypothetical protein
MDKETTLADLFTTFGVLSDAIGDLRSIGRHAAADLLEGDRSGSLAKIHAVLDGLTGFPIAYFRHDGKIYRWLRMARSFDIIDPPDSSSIVASTGA